MTAEEKSTLCAGRRLFRFAVLADTHINPVDGESPSPWETNRLANARARGAVRAIRALSPDFTVHMGDMVHPVPAQDSYAQAAERARAIFSELKGPLHFVPGNHDIGDKPLDWMPAEVVNDAFIETYCSHFGPDYYTFEHQNCVFIVLNAQLLNSGLAREAEQDQWLEQTLDAAKGRRIFVFSHYPIFINQPDEAEHYDNIGPAGRARLLSLFETHGVEACFGAHVHNYFINRHDRTLLHVLPAVSAVRHDYSDLFKVAPGDPEFGRDDNAKLGFFVVDIHERGHLTRWVRSYGDLGDQEDKRPQPSPVHSWLGAPCPVGVDLRQQWAEPVAITPSGAVDEFYRKKARNDYTLASLWETGIRQVRIPLDDLQSATARARVALLAEAGHEVVLFIYNVPQGDTLALLHEHRDLLAKLEIIVPSQHEEDAARTCRMLGQELKLPVFLSRLRSSTEAAAEGSKYTHFITHGYSIEQTEPLEALARQDQFGGGLAGPVFRIGANESPAEKLINISRFAGLHELQARAHVAMAQENPAAMNPDDAASARRMAEALFAASALPRLEVCFDTLCDIDRGYFPRLGLLDRRSNPRISALVFAEMQALIVDAGPLTGLSIRRRGAKRELTAQTSEGTLMLTLGDGLPEYRLFTDSAQPTVGGINHERV
ncbi:metallophosphoesterase family protein [Sediminimonas qiaohouensis]|uniref:Serine/threonine protein phosphatase n=1 Tax=Sediminimonas qiaohouensis TaxID=552061 RepID=A0A7C9HCE1_9RHOB|nr:metallophosphoesterase [Sediminimonas qiaohouensis]MTJ04787.1 serine/threonine protein phosphatase [Sediminimonas qiaohouensis]